MLRQHHLCMFYDFEATSKNPTEDHIISIGAVICEIDNGFQNPQEFHTFVFTKRPIDPVAEAVHGIHASDLIGAPPFPEAVNLWKSWILKNLALYPGAQLVIGGHNSNKFDGEILFCNFRVHRLDYDLFISEINVKFTFDTLDILRKIFKPRKAAEGPQNQDTAKPSFKLGDCYHTFCGHPLDGAHNALADARALYEIFISEKVKCTFTLQSLWGMMKNVNDYNRDIKKTCGVATQAIMQRTRADISEPIGEEPIFDDDVPPIGTDPLRMCLNCMTLTKISEHQICNVPTISLRALGKSY